MRKLKLQVQITADGFIGGPNGEMDWMVFDWDEPLKAYVSKLTEPVDCIVMGRKLAEGFIPYWASVANNPGHPEYVAGQKFTHTHKVVFTSMLTHFEGNNTVLATGSLAAEIGALKQAAGQDIMAYGGASFVSSLIQDKLVDEFYLFVNPVAIGKGLPIFNKLNSVQPLTLISATPFNCGIVVLHYQQAAGADRS